MTSAQLRNVAMYGLYVVMGAAIAAIVTLGVELSQPEDDPVSWRAVAAAFVVTLGAASGTAYGASRLPRPGSEHIRQDVDDLERQGVPRSQMVVLNTEDAAAALAGEIAALSPAARLKLLQNLEPMLRPDGGR